MDRQHTELRRIYDQLWHDAMGASRTGRLETDPFLLTILSLFAATEHHAPQVAKTPDYLAAVRAALTGASR